jgi:imidazolonepropionase-like amidohydrolase
MTFRLALNLTPNSQLIMSSRSSMPAPGLVDAHVHLKEASGLDCAAAAGISALRDAGFRHNSEQGIITRRHGPAVVASGWALYRQGGYGAAFGVEIVKEEQIPAEILRLKMAGADIIKAMASGMVSLKHPGQVTASGFDSEEMACIVAEAAAQGLGVMAHANGEQAILAAASAGVRSIEHGFFMTERALDLMAEKAIFWVPTLVALRRATGMSAAPETVQFIEQLILSQLSMLRRAHSIGVPLAIGTDCVLPDLHYRAVYDAEVALYEQAGIPRDQVMTIASEGGAKLLGK